MKNRVIRGSVIVIGPPRLICSLNNGTTLPALPSTFPNRVTTYFVFDLEPSAKQYRSAICLVQPIKLVGLTALSVETMTNF